MERWFGALTDLVNYINSISLLGFQCPYYTQFFLGFKNTHQLISFVNNPLAQQLWRGKRFSFTVHLDSCQLNKGKLHEIVSTWGIILKFIPLF